jgi:hypothetical protein
MAKKFKVYELDFGDTNLLSENSQEICEWIKTDLDNMDEKDELNYTVTIRMMTRKQIDNIPEWV